MAENGVRVTAVATGTEMSGVLSEEAIDVVDCLTKPFDPRGLLARLRAVPRRYKASHETPSNRHEKPRAYRFLGWG